MTDEQKQDHLKMTNQAIQILNRQITNLCYVLGRMSTSISAIMTFDDDSIREHRKFLDDDFFVAQEIVSKDAKGETL